MSFAIKTGWSLLAGSAQMAILNASAGSSEETGVFAALDGYSQEERARALSENLAGLGRFSATAQKYWGAESHAGAFDPFAAASTLFAGKENRELHAAAAVFTSSVAPSKLEEKLPPTLAASKSTNGSHISPTSPPSFDELNTFNLAELNFPHEELWRYESLSAMAKEGIYLLLVRNVSAENIKAVLENSATEEVGGAARIFEQITLMYEHEIIGFERGFLPIPLDRKFLSEEAHRVYSQFIENNEAIKLACLTDVERVEVGASFPIDWSQLTGTEKKFIEQRIVPHLQPALAQTYKDQREVQLDCVVSPPSPQLRRIVEVKSSLRGNFLPGAEEKAKIQLQVFRHALLVRQHRLEGIEVVIRAGQVREDFLADLVETLKVTGVKFLVRLEGGKRKKSITGGIEYAMRPDEVPNLRRRDLPILPNGERKEKIDRRRQEVEAEFPWTKEMRRWLQQMIPKRVLKIHQRRLDDFFDERAG